MGTPRTLIETGPESVPEFHVHIESARARGGLNTLLVVPRVPATALADALHDLHDPRGAIDLDARLGQLASRAPDGTAFLVGLDDQVWAFPSSEVSVQRWRDEDAITLTEPQVLQLELNDEIVLTTKQGNVELGRLRSLVDHRDPIPAADLPDRETLLANPMPLGPEQATRRRVIVRSAAGVAVILLAIAGVRFLGQPAEDPRVDAHVAPTLEEKVVGFLTHGGAESREAPVTTADVDPTEDAADQGAPTIADADATAPEEMSADTEASTASNAVDAVDAVIAATPPWQFQADGAITSSPLLVDGRVIFGCRDSHLYCLDAVTGEPIWSLPTASGIGSSPCSAGALVFVGSYDGRVLAIHQETGQVAWEGETGGRIVSSPCIVGDVLIVGSYDGSVHAFRHATGEPAWTFTAGSVVRASPERVGTDGVVVGTSGGRVLYLATADGSLRWEHTMPAAVHAQARWDEARECIYVAGQSGTVTRLPLDGGDPAWTISLGSEINAQPRLAGESVLVGTGKGQLVALDPSTGQSRWSAEAPRGFDACPLVLDETVVAPSYDGTLHVLQLADGNLLDRQNVGSEVFSSPTAGDDFLFLGTMGGTLHALALP